MPAGLGRTPMDLMQLRHMADYKPQAVTAREAKRAYDQARAGPLAAVPHRAAEPKNPERLEYLALKALDMSSAWIIIGRQSRRTQSGWNQFRRWNWT